MAQDNPETGHDPLCRQQAGEILRLKFEAGLSNEQVVRAGRVSKGVVTQYTRRVRELSLSWTLPGYFDHDA